MIQSRPLWWNRIPAIKFSYFLNRNVANNQINGVLPNKFGQLSALSTLDISSNSFTGDLPQSFTLLSSATDMNVGNNKFSGWIPNRLNNINLQKDGNSWNAGPAPTSPPATPVAARGGSQNRQPRGNNPSTNCGGSSDNVK
ncbi:STRUBBELIG-receptor family 7-like protein [Tanacetum coccineum]